MTEYISIQSSQDVILHFGTKGMRWGHRKDLGVGSSRGANGRRIKDVTNSLR